MDRIIAITSHHSRVFFSVLVALAFLVVTFATSQQALAAGDSQPVGVRIITLHDDGVDKGFVTREPTLRKALDQQGIRLDGLDRTEPGLDEKLVASSYQVNVYRARPVVVRDSGRETKLITSYRTTKQIAAQANIQLRDEDVAKLAPSKDPIADGVAEVMTIERATPFEFTFYGKHQPSYTMAHTVGEMLKEKGITMGQNDDITPGLESPIVAGMSVNLWRNGVQTITVDEDVKYEVEKIEDADQPAGYKKVQTAGADGRRTVTYEINMQNGIEVSRKEINSVTTNQPVKQVEVVGVKSNGDGLTKSKGVFYFKDSNGVSHRETYYDLPMNRVMLQCGMGGYYTVRADGAKVDRDGYIIIAAYLPNYPRCSVVETSLGAGKVYDTGEFTERHPHGFDLATDWSRADGI